ncbi:MAG: class I SAM-dependent methyltransferase, partial [Stackebrandtia sp.]
MPVTMAMTKIWDGYLAGDDLRRLETHGERAEDWLYLSILAMARHDVSAASHYAAQAARRAPDDLLATSASRYLGAVAGQGRDAIYTDPEGFRAFARGGGNRELYRRLSRRLREHYRELTPVSLLDVGVGDGMALLPALTDDVGSVDLLEPSRSLLEYTMAQLDGRQGVRALPSTLQQLATGQQGWSPQPHWSLAQATFSLHNVSTPDRRMALSWLAHHCDRLAIAEFDIAASSTPDPSWFSLVAERYRRGLAEYDGDGGVVSQAFLM